MPVYRVYHDGSHYVGIKQGNDALQRSPRRRAPETELHVFCSNLYKVAQSIDVKSKKGLFSFLFNNLVGEYDAATLEAYIPVFLDQEKHKYYEKVKRFRRKAFLNDWNYLITFTYDSNILDEVAFAKKLPECLSHLHSRRGWNYMAVWERGEKGGRLHMHVLAYIPPDGMIGALYPENYYDKKTHSRRLAWRNTFFDLRFGRTDFTALSREEVKRGSVLRYLLKYLLKSGERIIYSRGVPAERVLSIPEYDVLLEYFDYVEKAIISDDSLFLDASLYSCSLSDDWMDGIV